MEKRSMKEILQTTPRFCASPGYFAGRGATLSDLNYDILTHVKKQIVKDYGEEAGKGFVKMVASMENCNATDFINNCFILASNDFKWTIEKTKKVGFDFDKDENGNHNLAQGMAAIASFFGGGGSIDQTPEIRNRFLLENGIKPERTSDRHGNSWYYR